jgi:hypothetical protein
MKARLRKMGKITDELAKQRDTYMTKLVELREELRKVQDAIPIFDGAVQAMNVAINIAKANEGVDAGRTDELEQLRAEHGEDKQEE